MNKTLVTLAIIFGILLVGLAFVYWFMPANALPHYLPGYNPGMTTAHFKHGIGAFIVGIALFIFAWFESGKKKSQ